MAEEEVRTEEEREDEQDEELIREANLLTDLIVEKIAFVDEPADQDSKIILVKSAEEEDEEAKEEDETEKAQGYVSPADIISALQTIMEGEKDEKKRKRLNLIIANLKSFFGIKKAGRKISAANAAKIKEIAGTLFKAAKDLMELVGESYDYAKPYGYPYGYGKTTNISPQIVMDAVNKIAAAMVAGVQFEPDELKKMQEALKVLMDQLSKEEGDE